MASTRILSYIGAKEGFVSAWYLDPVHIPTIGYGFTWRSEVFRSWWTKKYGRKMKRGDTISQKDALEVLKLLVELEYEPPVLRKMPLAPANVKEASTSTVYNLGAGSLAWKWAVAFAANQIKQGADFLRVTGTTASGKKLPGLVKRRGEEADIAEHNRWPSWLKLAPATTAPETHIDEDDIRLAQTILSGLGYALGDIDGVPGPRTIAAVRRFQEEHGTLKVDGVIGRATLTALIRTNDARSKGKAVTATGGTTTVAGGVTEATGVGDQVSAPSTPVTPSTDLGWVGDLLLWGGIAILVLGLLYLAWRYRDELPAIIRRLA